MQLKTIPPYSMRPRKSKRLDTHSGPCSGPKTLWAGPLWTSFPWSMLSSHPAQKALSPPGTSWPPPPIPSAAKQSSKWSEIQALWGTEMPRPINLSATHNNILLKATSRSITWHICNRALTDELMERNHAEHSWGLHPIRTLKWLFPGFVLSLNART